MFRRDPQTLQIGLNPGVTVADRPGLRAILQRMNGHHDLDQLARLVPEFTGDLRALVEDLRSRGGVTDPPFTRRRLLRAHLRVDPVLDAFAATVADVVGPSVTVHREDPDVEVVLAAGEPSRGWLDELAARSTALLPVVFGEERVRIGPLVVPGHTPCLRCYDSGRADWDRAWAALVTQFGRRSRSLGVVRPLGHVAALEVAAELRAMAADQTPPTVGHVIEVGPEPRRGPAHEVPFHPQCGCIGVAA